MRLRLDFEQKINKLNNYNRKLTVGIKTLEVDIKDLMTKLNDLTLANKSLEQQYLEARSSKQMADTIIMRLKDDNQRSFETRD